MKNKGAYLILILEIALISALHAVKISQEEGKQVVSAPGKNAATSGLFHAGAKIGHWAGITSFLQVPLFNEQRSPVQR
jgi:hypothetical protein